MNKYQKFWEWFTEFEEDIYFNVEQKVEEYVPLIQEKLFDINENLAFEISEVLEDKTRQFIISADGIYSAFDDVLKLSNCDLDLSKWKIIPFRQSEEVTWHSVELDGLTLSYDEIYFTYEVICGLLDMKVYIKNYDRKDNRYVHAYFLLLDSLIGEYDAVTLFKETEVLPYTKKVQTYDFYSLKSIVSALKNKDNF